LRAALEGVGGANFVHLRGNHPGATFRVFGAANPALPPWKRMQVVAQCQSTLDLDKVEADVLDLAETACDVVADGLGLSDEQVQQAFEDIRVERSEIKLAPSKAAGLGAFSGGGALGSGARVAPAVAAELGIASKARPTLAAGSSSKAGLQRQQPVHASLPQAPRVPTAAKSMPQGPPPPPPKPPREGGQKVAAKQRPKAAAAANMPQGLAEPARAGAPPHAASSVGPLSARSAAAALGAQVAAGMPAPREPAIAKSRPTGEMPPPELPPTKKRKKQPGSETIVAGEVLKQTPAPREPPAVTPVVTPKSQSMPAVAPTPGMVGEAAAPPPTAAKATPKPAGVAPTPAGTTPEADDTEDNEDSSEDSAEEGEEEDEASDSSSSGEEDEDEDDDEEVMPSADGAAGTSLSSGGAAASSGENGEKGAASFAPIKVRLSKLGEFCCDVFACFAGGNPTPDLLAPSLSIDQRAKLDHCKEHLDFAGDLVTVWILTATTKRQAKGMGALCEYFVCKERVGMVVTPAYSVYMVPPEAAFLEKLGLASKNFARPGCLLALQVPADTDEGEEEEQDADAKDPAA